MNEPTAVRLTQRIAFPPEVVWEALTDPETLSKWWAAGDVRPLVGHTFTLDMGAFGQQACTVTAVEPARLFEYTFGEGLLDTTITWTLAAASGGTDLTLEHAGFKTDTEMGQRALLGMGAGWPGLLSRIEPVLAEE